MKLGITLKGKTKVGVDLSLKELQGAHKGIKLGMAGEGVFTGVEFLNKVNSGERVDIGKRVAVIGGGNTAIDAARVSEG